MLGKKLQATSQDKEMASLLGISVSTMIMITFMYSAVLGGLAGILVAPVLFVSIQMGSTIALKAFAATIIGGFGDVAGAIIGGLVARHHRDFWRGLHLGALQGRLSPFWCWYCFWCSVPKASSANASRRKHERAVREYADQSVRGARSKPMLLRHLPYFIGSAIVVALAATMNFDGYIHNILMQAVTFAIAVFGLSVVLGLCGQINLAQAAFFGLGAYAVGIGTSDYYISYWLCLIAGCIIALLAGALLGMPRRCGSAAITSPW